MRIIWTDPAVEDLRELHAYISRDSEVYASGFVERIIIAVGTSCGHPRAGRIVPERSHPNIRELLCQNYRIIYRIESDSIEILAVVHGARDLNAIETAPWNVS